MARTSASSASRWELTDTYSPTAIEAAPATMPANPVIKMVSWDMFAAPVPASRQEVLTNPSLAPNTAARSQRARELNVLHLVEGG